MNPTVAVCITTHNRRAELERTLGMLAKCNPPPDEILAAADGCTDGTVEWLRESHPRVQLLAHSQAMGSIPSRNELATACRSEVFVSFDDDSYPLERDFFARVAELFAENPRLAIASFPQRTDEYPESLTSESFGPSRFVGSFANSAAAIRRSTFIALGGYSGFFFHMYEEPDFALRCVAAGWQVRLETALTVRHHFTATQRNELRTHQRHARNELWSVLLRCPWPQVPGVATFRIARQFGYAWKRGLGWAIREPKWWFAALAGVSECLAERRTVPWPKYRAWMGLVRTPIESETAWNEKFGDLGS